MWSAEECRLSRALGADEDGSKREDGDDTSIRTQRGVSREAIWQPDELDLPNLASLGWEEECSA